MKKKPISKSPKKIREDLIKTLQNYDKILSELPTIKDSIIELYTIKPKEINELNSSNKSLFSFVIETWNKKKADLEPSIFRSNIDSAFKPVEEICKLLIKYMDPSALSITNKTGDLPLHWAIKNGHTKLCKLLINKLPSSSLELAWRNKDFYGEQETPLQLIYDEYNKLCKGILNIDTKHLQIVGNLLISKISSSAREEIISSSDREKIIKGPYYPQNELIKIIKKYENDQYKQLTEVIQGNNSNIQQVQELLDQMRSEQLMITSQDNTVLIDAIRAYNNPNRNTICELLINKNPEIVNKPNKLGYTALLEAVNQGNIELCKLIMPHLSYNMLNFGPRSGETPLKAAIESDKPEIVQYLIEQGYPIQDVLSIINDGPPSTTSKFHVSYNELIYQAIQSNSNLQELFKYAGEADNIYLSPQQLNQPVAYGESAQVIICNRLKAHIQNHGFPTHRESFLEKLRMVINNEELINENILGNIQEGPTTEEHIVIDANNNTSGTILDEEIDRDKQINPDTVTDPLTQLIQASALGNKNEVQSLLEQNADLFATNVHNYLKNEPLYSLEELEKINQLFPQVSKIPSKWPEAEQKYLELDIKKFKNTFEQVDDIASNQLSNIKDLAANIAVKIGLYLHYREKQYKEALGYFQEALKLKEGSLLDSVKILTYLGNLHETIGKYNTSLEYYNTAIKKISDNNANYNNRLDVASLHERLAATYENLYQMSDDEDKSVALLTDAIKHIIISLDICKELEQQSSLQEHEKSHSQTQEEKLTIYAQIYNTAAGIYETKGEPQKALDYYEKTSDIKEKYYDEEHPSIAETYNNIGLFYHSQALTLRSDINSSIDKIRFLCNKLKTGPIESDDIPNKFEEKARENLHQALEILEKYRGNIYLERQGRDIYGAVRYNLGLVHKALGAIEEAKQDFTIAITTLRELHPNGHDNIVKALNSLALIYKQQDNKEQAYNYYEEAEKVAKKIYGEDNNYITRILQENKKHLVSSMHSKEEQTKEKAALEKQNIDLKLDEREPINITLSDTDIDQNNNISTYDVRIPKLNSEIFTVEDPKSSTSEQINTILAEHDIVDRLATTTITNEGPETSLQIENKILSEENPQTILRNAQDLQSNEKSSLKIDTDNTSEIDAPNSSELQDESQQEIIHNFPEFNDQLAKDNDLEKENTSNPSKQLEFNLKVMASDIEELKQSNISDITGFVEEYIDTYKQQSEISVPIGFGLILNSTIALNETELALKIIDEIELGLVLEEFSSSDIVDIMTCVDGSGYSVTSTTLYSGNQKLFDALSNLIQNLDQEKITKTECISKDLRHLETIIRCPQFEEFDAKDCIESFIKPLYLETSITGVTSLIENT